VYVKSEESRNAGFGWAEAFYEYPYRAPATSGPILQIAVQERHPTQKNRSSFKTKLGLDGKPFEHGIGVHSNSVIRVWSPEPMATLSAWIGIDDAIVRMMGPGRGNVIFSIRAEGREIFRSPAMRGGKAGIPINVPLHGARLIELHVENNNENHIMNTADWADAAITTQAGATLRLDEMQWGEIPHRPSDYPFSFIYRGVSSNELLPKWKHEKKTMPASSGVQQSTDIWSEPGGSLTVRLETKRFAGYPAVEWLLYLENRGDTDTGIVSNIQSMDMVLAPGIRTPERSFFRLHRTAGEHTNPEQFFPSVVEIHRGGEQTFSTGGSGRSSEEDLPFYKIEHADGAMIVAVGWTGAWKSVLHSPDGSHLHLTAGLEKTHFKLHPKETVRLARMLALDWHGDPWEANAQFRELIYEHYMPRLAGEKPLPRVWVNTCIAGISMNHSTAAEHIAAIEAYAKVKGVEAYVTDAGWYEGGYSKGDGNYRTPNRKSFPDGLAPVAAAAKRVGLGYGIWFDVEMQATGSQIIRSHPEWFFTSTGETAFKKDSWDDGTAIQDKCLLNFGEPAAVAEILEIVEHYLDMPGFAFYRQDFNGHPLTYWSGHDAPDRQGITEIKHIMGMYAYWQAIAAKHPDFILEGCASGGKRIDLETIALLHTSQKSDLAGHHETDQTAMMALSQYLPNCHPSVWHTALDDYGFYSSMPAAAVPVWQAWTPGFDLARANVLMERFHRIRELLVGAWYPLLPPTLDKTQWIGSEYIRRDLGKGLFLVFRRENCAYSAVEVKARGLEADATYELVSETTQARQQLTGEQMMAGFTITLPKPRSADMIVFNRL
jgi:alpha-galactosidase